MDKKIRLLIVEDHAVTRDGLASYFNGQEDMELVGSVCDSASATQLAQATSPDVILLDLHLPGELGPCELVQTLYQVCQSKLVVFSGDERRAVQEAVIAAGADMFVSKVQPAAVVADVIRQVMRGKPQNGIQAGPNPSTPQSLSAAEKEILSLLACGRKYQEIAKVRESSAETVRKQCDSLQRKLNLDNREQLIAWAVRNGFDAVYIDEAKA